jgi:ribokinase
MLDEPERAVMLCWVRESTGERHFMPHKDWPHDRLVPAKLDMGYITGAKLLLLDGSCPTAGLVAAQAVRCAGGEAVLDASAGERVGDSMRQLVAQTDYLIGSSGFAEALTQTPDRDAAMQQALSLGPRVVVQTEGADGCYTRSATERFHTPAFPVNVVDTTGAGDVFHGAFIVGLLKGWALCDIAAFASAVAALKCTKLGGRSGIPTLSEATSFLAQRGVKRFRE